MIVWLQHRWKDLGRWPQSVYDLVIAVSVATIAWNERSDWPLDAPFGLAMAGALVIRRSRPVPVFTLCLVLAGIQFTMDGSGPRTHDLALVVAMVAVVSHAPRLRHGALAGLALLLGFLVWGFGYSEEAMASDSAVTAALVAFGVALWLMAYALRTRRVLVESLRERALTAERERDHLNQLALAGERAGIARELHDVVAHSLAVMVVQADGARYAMQVDPAKAGNTLKTIAEVGREALDDMHRIVDVLRGTATAPGPSGTEDQDRQRVSLERLGPITEQARAAGLDAALTTSFCPYSLSAAEELTIVRLVQESLTNVLRHAGPGTTVSVQLRFAEAQVLLEVVDQGNGSGPVSTSTADARRSGSGVIGMRERVLSHGGRFEAGAQDEGGWVVRARIPVKAGAVGTR